MIKNIVFDYGNVLIRFKPEQELRKFVSSDEEAKELRDLIYLSKPWKDNDRGNTNRESVIRQLCALYPRKSSLINKVISQCSQWLIMPEMLPGFLNELKEAGYHLFFLSNTNPTDYASMVGRYPILSAIPGIASFNEGILKPDQAIFELLLKRFSLIPSECLFIDDMEENTKAAESLGFQTMTLTTGADSLPCFLRNHPEIGKQLREETAKKPHT